MTKALPRRGLLRAELWPVEGQHCHHHTPELTEAATKRPDRLRGSSKRRQIRIHMADEQILRRLEALEVQKAADRQREELQAKLTAALERQSLRAELEKQALRAAAEKAKNYQ